MSRRSSFVRWTGAAARAEGGDAMSFELFLISPPLDGKVRLAGFGGREELSRLFRFELELTLADDVSLAAAPVVCRAALSQPIAFGVRYSSGEVFCRHGIITR